MNTDEEKEFEEWLEGLPSLRKELDYQPARIMKKGKSIWCEFKEKNVHAFECSGRCDNHACPIRFAYDYCRALENMIEIMYKRFTETYMVFICRRCDNELFVPKREGRNRKYKMCPGCGGKMYGWDRLEKRPTFEEEELREEDLYKEE